MERTAGLCSKDTSRSQPCLHQPEEMSAVEARDCFVGGVRQVSNDQVVLRLVEPQEKRSVLGYRAHQRMVQGMCVDAAEPGVIHSEVKDALVQIHYDNLFDLRQLQQLTSQQPFAAAQDQYPPRR